MSRTAGHMDFTCRRFQDAEYGASNRPAVNGDGYVEIMMDAKYSATAIHQPDGTERKIPAITQVAIPHVMLYTEGKWWRIGNDYLNERLNGGKGSSASSGSAGSSSAGSSGSSSSGRGSTKV